MRILSSWQSRVVVLSILVVAIVAASVTAVMGVPGSDGSQDRLVDNALLAASRDRLSICVQAVEGAEASTGDARSKVEAALARVSDDPSWASRGLDVAPPVTHAGCPGEPYLLQPGVTYGGKPIGDPAVQEVTEASEHRVFVFVLPAARINEIFGESTSIRVEPQEFLCEDHTCAEVTTGLYLSSEEVREAQVLEGWLEKAIGLQALVPEEELPTAPSER